MKYFFLTVIAVFWLTTHNLDAQVRTYSNEFLSLGVGAKALGMGNVQAASVNDVTAGYWNPAGLMGVKNIQVGLMHAEWFAGISKYDYVSVAMPVFDKKRTLGLSLIRFGVDDIPNTLFIIEPDGSVNYDNLSSFSAADYAVLLSYAQKIKKFRVGGNVKIVHRKVGSFANAWGFGIDLGAQYDLPKGFTLGLSIKDVTTTLNAWSFSFTEEEKAQLAATENVIPVNTTELTGQRIIFGAAHYWDIGETLGLLSEINMDITLDGKRNVLIAADPISIDPHIGFELNYDQFIFLRLGINNIQRFKDQNDSSKKKLSLQPNLGLGLNIKQVYIDYAFTGLTNIDRGLYSHIISLKLDLLLKKGKSVNTIQN